MTGKVKWKVLMPEALEAVAIMQEVEPTVKILDVGGGMKPLVFATHVIDILEYDRRGMYGFMPDGATRAAERYTEETYLEHDICVTPWPYADKEFDVVWCTQTIEDVRDPLAVVREMCRVGKVGYITTIHRNYESLFDVNGPDFPGWMHHRWLIEPDGDRMKFTFKTPLLQREEYRPHPTGERELELWWTENIEVYEYIPMSEQEIKDDLTKYVKLTKEMVDAA